MGPWSVVAGNPSVTRQTAQTRGVRTADPDPQLFLRIDRNKSIKMSGKLAVGVARDSQIFSEHQGASRGHLCDSMASCCCCVTERSGRGGCVEERRLAIEEQTRRHDVYVPHCRPDGSYTDEQCHNATGYCWCVTSDGKPIPGSSVHGRQHTCSAYFSGKML